MKENLTSKTGHFHVAKIGHYHVAVTKQKNLDFLLFPVSADTGKMIRNDLA